MGISLGPLSDLLRSAGSYVGSQLGAAPDAPAATPAEPPPSLSPVPQGYGKLGRLSDFVSPPANETLAPKGQLPRQLNAREQQQWAYFDEIARKNKLMQDALANERANVLHPNMEGSGPIGYPLAFAINKGVPAASPFVRAAAREIGDVAVGLPSYVANKMNAAPRTLGNLIKPGLGDTVAPVLPQPTFNDALAPIAALKTGTSINNAKEALDVQQRAMETVHPNSSTAGVIGGDVATIVGPRALMAEDLVRGYTNSPDMKRALAFAQGAGEGALEQAKAVWAQPWFQSLRRGLGKGFETAGEQAFLTDIHKEGNPVVNGIVSGGLQLGGSAVLAPLMMLPKTAQKAGAVLTAALATSVYNDWIPGGNTSFIHNLNDTIKYLGWGSALGVGAALLGAGRYRGSGEPFGSGAVVGGTRPAFLHHEFARRVPALAESINATLRTVPNSIVRMILGDEKSKSPVVVPVLSKVAANAESFTPKEIDMLGRGILNKDLRGTVDKMLKDQTLVDPNGSTFAERMGIQ